MLRKIGAVLTYLTILVVLLLSAALLGVRYFELTPYAADTGELLYVSALTPDMAQAGEIIAYSNAKAAAVGEIASIDHDEAGFVLSDGSLVRFSSLLGHIMYRVPYIGIVYAFLLAPMGINIAGGGTILLLLLLQIPDIVYKARWRKAEKRAAKNDEQSFSNDLDDFAPARSNEPRTSSLLEPSGVYYPDEPDEPNEQTENIPFEPTADTNERVVPSVSDNEISARIAKVFGESERRQTNSEHYAAPPTPAQQEQEVQAPIITEQAEAPQAPIIAEQAEPPKAPIIAEQEKSPQAPIIAEQAEPPQAPIIAEQAEPPQSPIIAEQEKSPQAPIIAEQTEAPQASIIAEQEKSPQAPIIAEQEKSPQAPIIAEQSETVPKPTPEPRRQKRESVKPAVVPPPDTERTFIVQGLTESSRKIPIRGFERDDDK